MRRMRLGLQNGAEDVLCLFPLQDARLHLPEPCCHVVCALANMPSEYLSNVRVWVQAEMRETTAEDFRYEDLERLGTDDLARITEWLTEKVDALSTRLKAEPKEDEVRGQLQGYSHAGKAGRGVIWAPSHPALSDLHGRRAAGAAVTPGNSAVA